MVKSNIEIIIQQQLQKEKLKAKNTQDIEQLDNKIIEEIEIKRKKELEKELNELKQIKIKKGKSAAIFKLKEKIVGSKKNSQEATTLKDPKTNCDVNTVDDIKRVSLDYCKNLLTNRDPKKEFENVLESKYLLHETRMKVINQEDEYDLSLSMFNDAIKRLKTKHPGKYIFIRNGGESLHKALFKLCKAVWTCEKIPDLWKQTNIIQLFKGKGNADELGNYRNIHTKIYIRKLFGDIVTHEMKEKVKDNVSKFQIRAMQGHRAQEHLFTLKTVIGYYNKKGKGLILSLYDISKYFDRENLRDCMGELFKTNVREKLYRLIFNLNKDTEVSVRTPVGHT